MIERFEKDKRVLHDAMLEQQCVSNNKDIAGKLCGCLKLLELKKGDVLFQQGDHDTDVYFILAGRVVVEIHGREISIRGPRQHVGEMAMIDSSAPRSGTVKAMEITVLAKVAEPDFAKIATEHPDVWRRLAVELADRLRQRAKYVRAKNPRPRIFLGSSVEGLPVLRAIQNGLQHDDFLVRAWTGNVFRPGSGTMEALEEEITQADFGVLILTKDDHITNEARAVDTFAPRDNVVLELGMCIGALGRKRAYMVIPKDRDLKIPTDMLGITPVTFYDDREHLADRIAPVCNQIREAVGEHGLR
jgi:predicted nucleotide-binding protein